jgi:L-alanine-DL-glutamate epimerase-like enolase superfamily enzyme
MRITDLKVYPRYSPEHRASLSLVKIETDAGVSGWGSVSLSGKEEATAECARGFRDWLIGLDPFDAEHIWQDLFRGSFWRGGPVIMTAISGIDTALWDLKGNVLGTPVYNLLGGRARLKVRFYRHAGGPETDEAKRRLDAFLEAGVTAVRTSVSSAESRATDVFEPRAGIEDTVARLTRLREYVGPKIDVCVDVHTRLSPPEAIEFCELVEPLRLFFVEDPIRSENPEVFRLIRAKTKTRLATGEQLVGKWQFRELISENLVDYLRVDLCHAGGITETKKIASWAEAYYVEMALHCTNGHLADIASLHLNLSIPNCGIQEYSGASRPLEGLVEGGYTMEDGYLVPTGEPGLGVRVNEEKLAALPPLKTSAKTRWRRPDGAVQDW